MSKVRASCKAMTDGKTRGKAFRVGDDLAEAVVSTKEGTTAQVRIFPDGSGLFEFSRGRDKFSLRWTEETQPGVEVFANFDGVEGVLVPAEDEKDAAGEALFNDLAP